MPTARLGMACGFMNSYLRFARLGKIALLALICPVLNSAVAGDAPASGPTPATPKDAKPSQVTSTGAVLAEETIRIEAPGTMDEILVKAGDSVKKGQMLAHTDLYSTKQSLDIARSNFEAKGNPDQALAQYQACTIQREQAEDAVRQSHTKSNTEQLALATALEQAAKGQYEAQMDNKAVQKIQLDYWIDEYARRIVVSPLDGVVSEVLVKPGAGVNYATPICTVRKAGYYSVLVTIPAAAAETASQMGCLMVLAPGGKTITRADIDTITDDPAAPGKNKIVKLLIGKDDLPAIDQARPEGLKFDVFVPN